MSNDKKDSITLSDLELKRAKEVLSKLKSESKSSSGPDIWFCNGHNKMTKEGEEALKSAAGPEIDWYCAGHSK